MDQFDNITLKQYIPKPNTTIQVKLFSYKGGIGIPLQFHAIPKIHSISNNVLCVGEGCKFCELYNKLTNSQYNNIRNIMLQSYNQKFNLNVMSQYLIPIALYEVDGVNFYLMRLWNSEVVKLIKFILDNELWDISSKENTEIVKIFFNDRISIESIEIDESLSFLLRYDNRLTEFLNSVSNIDNVYKSVNVVNDEKAIDTIYLLFSNYLREIYKHYYGAILNV